MPIHRTHLCLWPDAGVSPKKMRAISMFGQMIVALASGVMLWPHAVSPQVSTYSATEAPVAWRDYAVHVQARFREWLANEDVIRSFRDATREPDSNTARTVMAKVWITAGGKVERVNLIGLEEAEAATLRAAVVGRDIGVQPPADMLQPLNLKLSVGDEN